MISVKSLSGISRIALISALTLCLNFVSVGCSNNEQPIQNDISSPELCLSKKVIAEDIKSIGGSVMLDDSIYFLSRSDKLQLIAIDQSGNELLNIPIEANGVPSQLAVNDEYYVFLDIDYTSAANCQSCIRFLSRSDGSERSYLLSSIISDYIYGGGLLLREHDGVFYIQYSRDIIKLDSSGNVLGNIALTSEIIDMQLDESGNIYTLNYNRELECYNSKGALLKKDYRQINSLYASAIYLSDNEIYIMSEDDLYSYNTDNESLSLLSLWSDIGIYSPYVSKIFKTALGLIVQGTDVINEVQCLWQLEPIDGSTRAERTIIEVSYIEDGTRSIPLAAIKFNSAQSEYKVECKEYSSGNSLVNDYELDLISGKLGDVFVMQNNTDHRKYSDQGAFLELYELIDNDPMMSREDIYPCVLEALETDGSLYVITPEFKLKTLTAKTENLPDGDWDIEKLLTFEAQLNDEASLISGISRSSMMNILLSCGSDEFIDFENGTASFDSELFIKLLEYLKKLPESAGGSSSVTSYRENKIMLSDDSISSLTDYLMVFAKYGFDSEVTLIGYPSAAGGVCKVIPRIYCGISATSDEIEGSWSFIKFMMSGANLLDYTKGMQNIPSLRRTLDDWLEIEGESYYYFSDANGSFRGSNKPFTDEKMLSSGRIFHPDEQLFAEFDEFISSASAKPELASTIMDIIKEEIDPFFAGTKGAEETAKVIQDRVSLYVAE